MRWRCDKYASHSLEFATGFRSAAEDMGLLKTVQADLDAGLGVGTLQRLHLQVLEICA